MRKKLFIYHGIIILISLVSLLLVAIFTILNVNTKDIQSELRNDLSISRNVLAETLRTSSDETSAATTAGTIVASNNKNLRFTVIKTDGTVIYDSDTSSIEENHLSRPEIQNLEKFYTRYSSTLKKDMMYVACLDNSAKYFIRVAIPSSTINDQVNATIAITIGIFTVVLTISIFVDYYAIKASMKPLRVQLNRLSKIVSQEDSIDSDLEIESLALQIDETQLLIEDKINSLTTEKAKLNFIIDNMKQGLFILDEKMDVLLINKLVKEIFNFDDTKKNHISLFDVTILPIFTTLFRNAMNNGEAEGDLDLENKHFHIIAIAFEANWISTSSKGVSFTIIDMTKERNLERAKRDFFANASHELKSPLTSIIGYSQMIKNGFVTDQKEIDEDFDRILFEAKRMNDIVIQMLDLSKLEAKEDITNKEDVSFRAIILEQKDILSSQMNDKKIKFYLSEGDIQFSINKEDASSLVNNLLENAIRYNKDEGEINIKIDNENQTLSISDTGIGIPEKYQDRIFERFFRVDKARSRKLGGTGLGLSIVKHICLNNDIQISLDSKENEYSTFTLKFPTNEKKD